MQKYFSKNKVLDFPHKKKKKNEELPIKKIQ